MPDSDSDSDGENSTVTLPDGRMACYRHLRIVCDTCCVDYSAVEPDSDFDSDSGSDESVDSSRPESAATSNAQPTRRPPSVVKIPAGLSHRGLTRGTGSVIPMTFTSPHHPFELFRARRVLGSLTRYTHRADPSTFLIMTDGACLNNGQASFRAGYD